MNAEPVHVIGAGLAGSEAALQLAHLGHTVILHEMRGVQNTAVHKSSYCAELVCSNSFKSTKLTTAAGLLKEELGLLESFLLEIARNNQVQAGSALAVDRDAFARAVTEAIEQNPMIRVVHEEVTTLPKGPCIVATGPVTSDAFFSQLMRELGDSEHFAFYDAVAPIVDAESLDMGKLFFQSRYEDATDKGDYLNATLDKDQYLAFVEALVHAKKAHAHAFEKRELFSACQPIEEIARSGTDALRYGPLKPKGIIDPKTGTEPYACVQLRAENTAHTCYNLVGFQTNLTFGEQKRVFSLIPGLENATYFRYGVLHKNTFLKAPSLCNRYFQAKLRPNLFFAGQVTGTEGYTEAIATGLVAARALHATLSSAALPPLPTTSALGSLLAYAQTASAKQYQPMHVNFGLVPPLKKRLSKKKRMETYVTRAQDDFAAFLADNPMWKLSKQDG